MTRTVARSAIATLALAASAAGVPAADERRPGSADMSPALQAMQRDDTRNPAMLWVAEGEVLWSRAAANGRRCAGCHTPAGLADAPARYPVFDPARARPVTLAARIDECRTRQLGQPPQGADGADVLALNAYLAHQARGRTVAPPDDPRLTPWQERGRAIWQQRMGQLHLACAHCHDQRAGHRLGGAVIPQAHPTGYPLYRLEWQTVGSLERRLRSCLAGVRAEPFAPGADEWVALEAYLMRRAAGMALEGTAVRP